MRRVALFVTMVEVFPLLGPQHPAPQPLCLSGTFDMWQRQDGSPRSPPACCPSAARRFPSISGSWRDNPRRVIAAFADAPEIRRVIYATNAIDSSNALLRKLTGSGGRSQN